MPRPKQHVKNLNENCQVNVYLAFVVQ